MWNRMNRNVLRVLAILGCVFLALRGPQASAQQPMSGATSQLSDLGEPLSPIPEDAETMEYAEADYGGLALPADCGLGCYPSWYVQGEMLYLKRADNGPLSMSMAYELPDFDYEEGLRVTVGHRRDCSEGWEVSYVGPLQWETAGEASGFPLDSYFSVPGGDVDISAFNQAEYHRQTFESELHSFEVNQRFYDWDTMSCLYGVRYIDLEEKYGFQSLGPLPLAEQGQFNSEVNNRLIGPQCGLDIFYPVGASNRLTLIGKTKLGVYANFAEGDVQMVNAGVAQINNSDDEVAFAFQGELGIQAKLQLTRRLSIQGGYELWYLYGLASANESALAPLSRSTGRNLECEEDTWFHGATLGGTFVW